MKLLLCQINAENRNPICSVLYSYISSIASEGWKFREGYQNLWNYISKILNRSPKKIKEQKMVYNF